MARTVKKSAPSSSALSAYDGRPFFAKALAFGVQQGVIGKTTLEAMRVDGAKGMVQIADFFGTAYLRANLEQARDRLLTLASLYLEETSGGDLSKAAMSLRDQSFLSHSRGGSDLLKKLHAMPKSTLFGDHDVEPIKDFLGEWSLYGLRIVGAYRELLAARKESENSLAAAAWFAEKMGIARSTLAINSTDERYLCSAEGVIRTALLLRLAKEHSCPNRADFARLVVGWRAKGIPPRTQKLLQTSDPAVPPAYRALEQSIGAQIVQYDLPHFLNPDLALDALMHRLEERYYLRPTGIEEVSEYDAMVSAAWTKVMKGKTEPDARLTAFLCLSANIPPKPSITETAARAVLRTIREHGFNHAAVLQFINDSAPFDLRDSLLELWQEEFVPFAEVALFEVRDVKLVAAMHFLKENCHITVTAARKKT